MKFILLISVLMLALFTSCNQQDYKGRVVSTNETILFFDDKGFQPKDTVHVPGEGRVVVDSVMNPR